MHITRDGRFERTDIWREGEWVDLWSVVHFLSGISLGFALSIVHFGAAASVVLALVLLTAYEMWEALVQIEETPANRFMDVVVGMASFLPTFFFVAPALSTTQFIFVSGSVLTVNIVISVFGWYASQKAVALETRLRARYIAKRAQLKERKERLRKKIHHDI